MLNTKVEEILFNEEGKVTGIRSGENTASAPLVICDPSYVKESFIRPTGKVIRAICLLNHTIPNTGDAPSIQIILPAKQLHKQTGKYSLNQFSDHLYFIL
jgi:Rab GDP dissociation inhibitor